MASEKEVVNKKLVIKSKHEKIQEGLGIWTSFYRCN